MFRCVLVFRSSGFPRTCRKFNLMDCNLTKKVECNRIVKNIDKCDGIEVILFGMVFSKFIKNMSEIIHPLRRVVVEKCGMVLRSRQMNKMMRS